MLKLYNSKTRKEEEFIPFSNKKVTIYVCGITPYDTTHLGHAFTYISFDVLIRYLIYSGYSVTYTQNVTDINDRDKDILQRAKEMNIPWQKLATFWTDRFLKDMKALNWIMPNNYLKASENIDQMVILIQKLLKNGYAYIKNGSVYFDITKKNDFGKLSKLDKSQMLKKAKEFDEDILNPDKKNPLDITLWRETSKNQEKHIPSFNSPFGPGRPGWHVECSAMSTSTLGGQIDIHGGGIDLIYPHHESEIAQSEGATNKSPFVKYWMHTGSVSYKGEKMSKSLGNIVMVSDLLKKYSANSIRLALISHHYRKDWEFFEEELKKAEEKLSELFHNQKDNLDNNPKYEEEFKFYMDNDLNTPKILDFLMKEYKNMSKKQLSFFLSILGFTNLPNEAS